MVYALSDLLVHPARFFGQINQDPPDFPVPLFIVGSGGLISLFTPYFIYALFPQQGVVNIIFSPYRVAWELAAPFIAWFLLSLGLFLLCRIFSGTGKFPATLQTAGYGMLPLTLIAIMALVTSPLSLTGVAMTLSPDLQMFVLYTEIVLYLLLVAWSIYLWTCAMEKTHALSRGRSLAASAIVGILYVFWALALFRMVMIFVFSHLQ
ncbi:Yip1 family protein [Methanoregula sp.]|uniref:Yip1 family protein n=1 Tax=Methanoregula sp. TaxID=2052170 RepID=UPI002BE8CF94|nr:Yip1 family protein [Methanoregula sp.]HVP95946.1 Yip1 family protein [Methanoregula sp.]